MLLVRFYKPFTLYVFFLFREYYRATSKRPDAANRVSSTRDQVAEASNQVASTTRYRVISNEINPLEVLSSRDAANQSKLRRNKKQQINKGRESKILKLTGNVDLGNNVFRQNKQPRRKSTRKLTNPTMSSTTTEYPNTISEVFQPNHHRHNHYDSRPETQKVHNPLSTETSTSYPVTYPTTDSPTTTTRAYFIESTSSGPSFNTTSIAAKLLEKVTTFFWTKIQLLNVKCVCCRNNAWRIFGRSFRSLQMRRNLNLWSLKRSEKLERTRALMTRFRKSPTLLHLLIAFSLHFRNFMTQHLPPESFDQ